MFFRNLKKYNLIARIISISLFVFIISGISCNLFKPKVEVFIEIETYLETGEPGEATAIINNEKKEFLDEKGKGFWQIKKKIGETVNIRFEKQGYSAIDKIIYTVKPEGNYIKKRIAFRKIAVAPPPPPKPEPKTEISIKVDFITTPHIADVNIYMGDEKIGATNSSGTYQWEATAAADEKGQIQFRVDHSTFNLKTVPQQLTITNQGVDIKKQFTIIPHIRKTPLVKAQLINSIDKMPLPNIELRFSDSNENLITDKDGMVEYLIQETTYKKDVNIEIIKPNNLFIVDGFKPITIVPEMLENIDMIIGCKVSGVITIAFENLSGEKLADVMVSVEGGETYKSNKNGQIKIPINSINRKYILNISKIKYQDVSKEVVPDKWETDCGVIRLRGVTGVIIVVDSLSNKPVPFVSLFEDGKNIGQTGSDGRVIVGVFLNTPMKLEFIPSDKETHQKKVETLKFVQSGDIKRIKLKPHPYDLTFNFMSDGGGGPVEGVEVKYKMLQKQSDNKGNVQIRTYDILTKTGSIDNSFKIAYKSYKTEYKCAITPDVRIYKIPTIYIPTRVKVTIKTNPPGGTIKVFDSQGNIVLEGNDPLSGEVLPDLYRVEGQYGETKAKRQYMISDDMEIPFPIFNPIDLIIQKYKDNVYSQAIEIYEDPANQENINRNDKNYCDALNCVFKAYAQLTGNENKSKAVEAGEKLINEKCVSNDPYFLFNLAGRYQELGKWEKADDFYERANNWKTFVETTARLQFAADCIYFRAYVRVERVLSTKSFSSNSEKCLYLQTTNDLWREFVQLATDRGLDFKESDYLKQKIDKGMKDAGCK